MEEQRCNDLENSGNFPLSQLSPFACFSFLLFYSSFFAYRNLCRKSNLNFLLILPLPFFLFLFNVPLNLYCNYPQVICVCMLLYGLMVPSRRGQQNHSPTPFFPLAGLFCISFFCFFFSLLLILHEFNFLKHPFSSIMDDGSLSE